MTARFGVGDVNGYLTDLLGEAPKSRVHYVYHKSGSWVQVNDDAARGWLIKRLDEYQRNLLREGESRDPQVDRQIEVFRCMRVHGG